MKHPTKPSILVVENCQFLREAISSLLIEVGYEVTHMKTCQKALAFAQHQYVNLVICDIHSDEMYSHDFIRTLRKYPGYQHVPVIVLSADNKSHLLVNEDQGSTQCPQKESGFLHMIRDCMESKPSNWH